MAEVPGLVVGSLRGDSVALRRIVGARRTGRWGIALALAGFALAAPSPVALLQLGGLHLALTAALLSARERRRTLGARSALTLPLWTTAPVLAAAAALRPWTASLLPALGAVGPGHLLLWRGLRRELL